MNPLEIKLPFEIINKNAIVKGEILSTIISPDVLVWFKENSMIVGYKSDINSKVEILDKISIKQWSDTHNDILVFDTMDNLLLFKMSWL